MWKLLILLCFWNKCCIYFYRFLAYGLLKLQIPGPTPVNGTFSFINVMAEEDLMLHAQGKNQNNELYYGVYPETLNLEENSTATLSECIVVKIGEADYNITIIGRIVDEDNNPVIADITLYARLSEGYMSTIVDSSLVNGENGSFELNFQASDSLIYYLQAFTEELGGGKSLDIFPDLNVYDIGNIVLVVPIPPE